jgi:hypothetical protein
MGQTASSEGAVKDTTQSSKPSRRAAGARKGSGGNEPSGSGSGAPSRHGGSDTNSAAAAHLPPAAMSSRLLGGSSSSGSASRMASFRVVMEEETGVPDGAGDSSAGGPQPQPQHNQQQQQQQQQQVQPARPPPPPAASTAGSTGSGSTPNYNNSTHTPSAGSSYANIHAAADPGAAPAPPRHAGASLDSHHGGGGGGSRSARSSFVLENLGGRDSVDQLQGDGSSGGDVDVYGRPSFAAFEPPRQPLLPKGGKPGPPAAPSAAAAARLAPAAVAGISAEAASQGGVFEAALPPDLAWRYRQLGALLPQAPLPLATLQRVWRYADAIEAAEAAHIFEMQVRGRLAVYFLYPAQHAPAPRFSSASQAPAATAIPKTDRPNPKPDRPNPQPAPGRGQDRRAERRVGLGDDVAGPHSLPGGRPRRRAGGAARGGAGRV